VGELLHPRLVQERVVAKEGVEVRQLQDSLKKVTTSRHLGISHLQQQAL